MYLLLLSLLNLSQELLIEMPMHSMLYLSPLELLLRETFAAPSKGHGRHVKQSGGHGQFAVCDLEVEPLPSGGGWGSAGAPVFSANTDYIQVISRDGFATSRFIFGSKG